MRKRSLATLAVFAVLAVILGGAALAWACGPQAQIQNSPNHGVSGDPASRTPGTSFTVSGSNFREGPVEIHWNSVSGPLLGTATGPVFSVNVTVPYGQAEGVYYVVAVQEGVGSPPASFTVTGTAEPAESSSSTSGGDERTRGTTSAQASGADGRGGDAKTDEPRRTDTAAPTSPGAVTTTTTGTEVFTPSVAPAAPERDRSPKADDRRQQPEVAAPTEGVVSSEGLFDGLEGPSVVPGTFDSFATGGRSGLLTVGVMLLGTGLVAMLMAVLVAGARRRRTID